MMLFVKEKFVSFAVLLLLFLTSFVVGKSSISSNETSIHSINKLADYETVELIEDYLQKQVPGLTVSYREVFDAIITEGYDVYVKGGLIRDLLQVDGSQPVDVDFSYSCTADQLETILTNHQWQYTRLPGYDFVDIGDHEALFLEGTPLSWSLIENEYKLDFTVNNILYYLNTKTFIENSEVGIKDVRNRKLSIIAEDWRRWLYADDPEEKSATKIFRFWKMVAKGYIYTVEFEELVRNEALSREKTYPEYFKKELVEYLASHYRTHEEVVLGARIIMGNDWVEKHVVPLETEITRMEQDFKKELDEYTFFKNNQ